MFRYAILIVFSISTAFAADTEKDKILSTLNLILNNMKACAESYFLNTDIGMESDEPEMIWRQYHSQLNQLLEKYVTSHSGVSKIDLWKIYLLCENIRDINFGEFLKLNISFQPEIFPDKTLMKLAQKAVTESAASTYRLNDLKLGTIMRDDNDNSFYKCMQESCTLRVPMRRAYNCYKSFNSSKDNEFLFFFSEELNKGYWSDDCFVKAVRYMILYFKYEFLLAKTNKKLLNNFPGLYEMDTDNFAKQQMATILALYLVVPFLLSQNPALGSTAKLISGLNQLAINYSKESKESKGATEPKKRELPLLAIIWHTIIDKILASNEKDGPHD